VPQASRSAAVLRPISLSFRPVIVDLLRSAFTSSSPLPTAALHAPTRRCTCPPARCCRVRTRAACSLYVAHNPPSFALRPQRARCPSHDFVLRPPQVGQRQSLCARRQWLVLTALQAPTSPAAGTTPVKKDPNAPEPTPLEKLLVNAGPLRSDGSDKFFGFENVSAPLHAAVRASTANSESAVWQHLVRLPCPGHHPPLVLTHPPATAIP
jgi:hypothetical protein